MLRICLICGVPPHVRDGVGDYARILAQCLVEQGNDVRLITGSIPSADTGGQLDGGVKWQPLVQRWDAEGVRTILGRIRQDGPDLVSIQYEPHKFQSLPHVLFLPLRLKACRCNSRVVTTLHENSVPRRWGRLGKFCLFRYSDHIITPSEHVKRTITRHGVALPPHKVSVIPVGATVPAPDDPEVQRFIMRVKERILTDKFLLSYFGAIYPGKGFEEVLRCLHSLRSQGRKVLLLHVGQRLRPESDVYHRRLRGLIQSLNLEGSIIWCEDVPDGRVSSLLQCSDVCVLPYGGGVDPKRTSCMAALQSAVPVVTTQGKQTPEHFVHGENVLLADPGDLDALTACVTALMDDRTLRERVARGGRDLASHYDWSFIAEQYLDVFRHVTDHKQRASAP